MAISHWPLEERPREKLLAQGATVLSDAELLAIFLRTGLPGVTAIDLARELLAHFGGPVSRPVSLPVSQKIDFWVIPKIEFYPKIGFYQKLLFR